MRITRGSSQDGMREIYITAKRQHRRAVRSTVSGIRLVQSPVPLLASGDPGKGTIFSSLLNGE